MNLKIGVIYDKPPVDVKYSIESRSADKQKQTTKEEICSVLRKKYDVVEVLADDQIIQSLTDSKIDLAFPLCTGITGESRQSQVPAILEMLGIPYIGSGILAHSLALNKSKAKQIFDYNNISTPTFQSFHTTEERLNPDLKFPLIVKPSCEGSGFGIHKDSVVYNEQDLIKKVNALLKKYQPPVLVEEFIEGRELTVGIIGNGDSKQVLPIMEIDFEDVPEDVGKFYTYEVKCDFGEETKYLCPAQVSKSAEKAILSSAQRAFDVLGCKDLARVDVRLQGNQPYIIEINSLPGLKPEYSDLPKMASKTNLCYDDLIFKIVDSSIERLNIEQTLISRHILTEEIS